MGLIVMTSGMNEDSEIRAALELFFRKPAFRKPATISDKGKALSSASAVQRVYELIQKVADDAWSRERDQKRSLASLTGGKFPTAQDLASAWTVEDLLPPSPKKDDAAPHRRRSKGPRRAGLEVIATGIPVLSWKKLESALNVRVDQYIRFERYRVHRSHPVVPSRLSCRAACRSGPYSLLSVTGRSATLTAEKTGKLSSAVSKATVAHLRSRADLVMKILSSANKVQIQVGTPPVEVHIGATDLSAPIPNEWERTGLPTEAAPDDLRAACATAADGFLQALGVHQVQRALSEPEAACLVAAVADAMGGRFSETHLRWALQKIFPPPFTEVSWESLGDGETGRNLGGGLQDTGGDGTPEELSMGGAVRRGLVGPDEMGAGALGILPVLSMSGLDPEEVALAREDNKGYSDARKNFMQRLSSAQRQLFQLLAVRQRKGEIASSLGVTRQTIHNRERELKAISATVAGECNLAPEDLWEFSLWAADIELLSQ